MTTGYIHRKSLIHAIRADVKLLVLLIAGTGLFLVENICLALVMFGLTLAACYTSRIEMRQFLKVLKATALVFVLLFAFQLYTNDIITALIICLRLAILLLLSVLLTLTTRVGDMLNVFRRALGWTSRFGVDVEKASLAISLAIRFVPLIAEITAQVREAQAARGLEHNVFAVAMPVLHRTIKMAGDIADAIDARS